MGPFHIPWSTFGAVLMLAATILLALIWACFDKRREMAKEDGGPGDTPGGNIARNGRHTPGGNIAPNDDGKGGGA